MRTHISKYSCKESWQISSESSALNTSGKIHFRKWKGPGSHQDSLGTDGGGTDMDQQNKTDDSGEDPHREAHRISDKGKKAMQWRKIAFSIKFAEDGKKTKEEEGTRGNKRVRKNSTQISDLLQKFAQN